MISRNIFTDIIMMMALIIFQIFVLNRIEIDGKYSPVVYPVFVLFYPFYRNKYIYLLMSFLIGLGIDMFMTTWGINAFATVTIAYFRTLIFKSATDSNDEVFSFNNLMWSQFILFIFASIFFHQFMVQFIEFFKVSRLLNVFKNVIITAGISGLFIVLYALIFKIKEKI